MDKDNKLVVPEDYDINDHLYEKEMFMRYFEELEIALKKEYIKDVSAVYETFSFYALRVSELGDLFVPDYNDNHCWINFHRFIHRMRVYEENNN